MFSHFCAPFFLFVIVLIGAAAAGFATKNLQNSEYGFRSSSNTKNKFSKNCPKDMTLINNKCKYVLPSDSNEIQEPASSNSEDNTAVPLEEMRNFKSSTEGSVSKQNNKLSKNCPKGTILINNKCKSSESSVLQAPASSHSKDDTSVLLKEQSTFPIFKNSTQGSVSKRTEGSDEAVNLKNIFNIINRPIEDNSEKKMNSCPSGEWWYRKRCRPIVT